MNTHVESELTRLPEPVPPGTLKATVMARVSRLAEQRPPAFLASPASMESAREERARSGNDLPAWVAACAGLAVVIVSWVGGRLEPGSLPDLLTSHIGAPNLVNVPFGGSAVVGLALGLLLYLAGLFAPLRNRR